MKSFIFAFVFLSLFSVASAGTGDFLPARDTLTEATNTTGTGSTNSFNNFEDNLFWGFLGHTELNQQYSDTNSNDRYQTVVDYAEANNLTEYLDERELVRAKLGTEPDTNYYSTLGDSLQNDNIVRVQVFVHNNAEDWSDNRYTANNTEIEIDWTDIQNVSAQITADNADTVSDIVDFNFADDTNLFTFQLNSAQLMTLDSGVTQSYTSISATSDGATSTFDLGDVAGCNDHTRVLYADLQVTGSFCGDGITQSPNADGVSEQCDDGNTTDGDGCSATCQNEDATTPTSGGGGGGGGGGSSNPSVGTCTVADNGAFQCTPRYPVDDDEYEECLENYSEEICLNEWASRNEYQVCGAEVNGVVEVPHSSDPTSAQLESQCNSILGTGNGTCEYCPSCFSADQQIKKYVGLDLDQDGVIEWEDDQITQTNKEKINYKVILDLGVANAGETVTSATVKFYDFVIPSDSGNIWSRSDLAAGWSWNAGGNYFEKTLNGSEISTLNGSGLTTELTYQMDSGLDPAVDQSSYLKNVAFATLEYTYFSSGALQSRTIGIGDNACENLSLQEVANGATLGDSAEARLVRPFVQATGGANVGVSQSASDDSEKLFGTTDSGTSGQIFVGDSNPLFAGTNNTEKVDDFDPLTQSNLSENGVLDSFENAATETETFFDQSFRTTADNSGVYFLDLAGGNLALSDLTTLSQPATFVIENGNVEINTDFEISNDHFAAFIVQGGNLIIDSAVEKLDGLFIVENGEIQSNGDSFAQLQISGGLIGNAENLLSARKFIGTDPEAQLEPSLKINFDSRLLDATPPLLQSFLGSDWRQSVQ